MDPRRAKMFLYAFAGAGLVGLAVALIVIFASGKTGDVKAGSDKAVAAAMRAAGCTYESKPPLPPKDKHNFHSDSPTLSAKVKWSTFPPSAGGHYGAWAIWNFYIEPVDPRRVVHNLEHGGVVIWWGPKVPAATVEKLRAFYDESPNGMFGTPLAGLGSKVALSAWTGDPSRYTRNGYFGIGHVAVCKTFDEQAFTTFRDAYRGNGPEGVPLSADAPGQGPQ